MKRVEASTRNGESRRNSEKGLFPAKIKSKSTFESRRKRGGVVWGVQCVVASEALTPAPRNAPVLKTQQIHILHYITSCCNPIEFF